MKSFIKIALFAIGVATIAACETSEKSTEATTKPIIDTTSFDAITDSVAPTFAEPDSVPGDTTEDKE